MANNQRPRARHANSTQKPMYVDRPSYNKMNSGYPGHQTFSSRNAHARASKEFHTYDTSYIKPHQSKAPAIICGVVAVVIIVALGFFVYNTFLAPKSGDLVAEGTQVTFTINSGESGSTVADNLVKAKLITSASDFKNELAKRGDSANLKPGTYTLVGGMSVSEIINAFVAGPNLTSLTVPEGMTLSNIADLVASATNGSVTAQQFKDQAANVDAYRASYSFIGSATSLEGFLFPKTYSLDNTATADSIIKMMLDQYQAETASLDYSYPSSKGFSNYQVLIMASIVEKESDENTRAQVAAVFYNRLLNQDGPSYGYLQSDATTAYYVGHDPSADEVHADNAYSTYTNKGLPPTPICNPGIEAIKAVCSPDMNTINDGYYFFYFKQGSDGKMQYFFSKTYDEHQQVIADNS